MTNEWIISDEEKAYFDNRLKYYAKHINANEHVYKALAVMSIVWNGLHHCDDELATMKQPHSGYVSITTFRTLSTWDFNELTNLIIAAHRYCIRVEIHPCNMQKFRIAFTRRTGGRDGDICTRHPDIEEAVELFDKHYGGNGRELTEVKEKMKHMEPIVFRG